MRTDSYTVQICTLVIRNLAQIRNHIMRPEQIQTYQFDGEVFYPASHIAKVLCFSNPRRAVQEHCFVNGVRKEQVKCNDGVRREINLIDAKNVIRLLLASKIAVHLLQNLPQQELIENIFKHY